MWRIAAEAFLQYWEIALSDGIVDVKLLNQFESLDANIDAFFTSLDLSMQVIAVSLSKVLSSLSDVVCNDAVPFSSFNIDA